MSSSDIVNILLVDDRHDGLLALEVVLSSPRYNLVKASSGAEAIAALPKYEFAMILMDVQMPEMDGFETVERIKKDHRYKDIPIIFITAINKDERYVYQGYNSGAVDYILKPFDSKILQSKVAVFTDLYLKTKRIQEQAEQLRESERRERYLKLAELELQSLKRYRNLADAIPHIVWRAHGDGTLDYFNSFWTRFTGMSQEMSRGDGWQSAFESDDLMKLLKAWVFAITTGETFEIECRIRAEDGAYRWHWMRFTADNDGNGRVLSWLVTSMDIHDRRIMEENLIMAKNAADSANRAKSHFLANMSHEIRTPLGAILGYAELLSKPQVSEDEKTRVISTIQRNGQSLLKIIDEILDLSKVEAGRIEFEKIPVPLDALLSDIAELMKNRAHDKEIGFEVKLETPVPSEIQTDPTRLRQLFNNLIGNAIKFTERGKVDVKIRWAELESDGSSPAVLSGKLQVAVTDSGIGIDSEKAKILFQPFTQVDGTTTRRFGGTGLGLALSRQLAQAMGGNVWIEETNSGTGSTFVFEIMAETNPRAKMMTDLLVKAEPKKEIKKDFPKDYLGGMNILLAEDSKDNQFLITYFLEQGGAHVDLTDDGRKAVTLAEKNEYDLILLDIQMPEMDGYEAVTYLRNKGYQGAVVAITAHALKEDKEYCLKLGFDNHVTKPIQKDILLEEVRRYRKKDAVSSIGQGFKNLFVKEKNRESAVKN